MKFTDTSVDGVYVVDLEPIEDDRGFFARQWSTDDFSAAGFHESWVQCNVAYSKLKGTIRGLHLQLGDAAESKLVWCSSGAVFDVAVDLRPDSPTAQKWIGVELTASNMRALYMPKGTAHGYQTLESDARLWYMSDHPYERDAAAGARWNDPAFGIDWPLHPGPMSDQDRGWPLRTEPER